MDDKLTKKELAELLRLQRLWATFRASLKQIIRCSELETQQRAERYHQHIAAAQKKKARK